MSIAWCSAGSDSGGFIGPRFRDQISTISIGEEKIAEIGEKESRLISEAASEALWIVVGGSIETAEESGRGAGGVSAHS